MKKLAIAAFMATAVGSAHAGGLLWDNGGLVTHPGAGPGGVDVSMASAVPNSGGSNVNATIWRADDFTVGGPGWIVSGITTYLYDTGFATPRWTDGMIQIRDGAPGGAVMASAAVTWGLAGVNRVFNGAGNVSNTQRQVNFVSADFGAVVLDPGTYWMTLTVTMPPGNAWFPYVMEVNPLDPNDPTTVAGNSMVSLDAGVNWQAGIVGTDGWNQSPEMSFQVFGEVVPEPATMLALGLGLAALAARRRRKS